MAKNENPTIHYVMPTGSAFAPRNEYGTFTHATPSQVAVGMTATTTLAEGLGTVVAVDETRDMVCIRFPNIPTPLRFFPGDPVRFFPSMGPPHHTY